MQSQLRRLPVEVREGLVGASPEVVRGVIAAYREHRDTRGRCGLEVTTPPTPGSNKYPWLKRPRACPAS